ncbi:hypothetical protein C0J52_02419 [Blattella germanica]|nr:hypothetical protein C0J52_02419 [Blattella germanica]
MKFRKRENPKKNPKIPAWYNPWELSGFGPETLIGIVAHSDHVTSRTANLPYLPNICKYIVFTKLKDIYKLSKYQ